MSTPNPPVTGEPIPAMDLAGYTKVTIVKTDEIEGHVYKRGEQHSVDAATLAALTEKGMVGDGATG